VRSIRITTRAEQVQPFLGILEWVSQREPELEKPRGADRDQQRLDRLLALAEIGEALLDQLGPGKLCPKDSSSTCPGQTVAPAAEHPGPRTTAVGPGVRSRS
jgi:hypothetical protein